MQHMLDMDTVELAKMRHVQHTSAAQYLSHNGKFVDTIYNYHYDSAMTQYALVGRVLHPWESCWDEMILASRKRQESKLDINGMAGLIKKFEALKKELKKD